MKHINLSDGEWKIMNLLWENPPYTITELTSELKAETGWSKNSVIVMLNRMEKKGAVLFQEGERAKLFFPAVDRQDVVVEETKGFLDKVYKGSLSFMVNSMVEQNRVSSKELEELYTILKKAEEENK